VSHEARLAAPASFHPYNPAEFGPPRHFFGTAKAMISSLGPIVDRQFEMVFVG
jgi:hypothetical protein